MLCTILCLALVGRSVASAIPAMEMRSSAIDPSNIQVSAVVFGGTGCPSNNTVATSISGDRSTVTLSFSDYIASIGPSIPVDQSRQNCQINLNLNYPGGIQYSLTRSEYRGHASLAKGVSAGQKSTYYFSGQSTQSSATTNFSGPYSNDYVAVNDPNGSQLVWSTCGGSSLLNVNSEVALTSASDSAFSSINTTFMQVNLQWQTC